MKVITTRILPLLFLVAVLATACGEPVPQTLEEKKALLQQKKSELMALTKTVNELQAEISKEDPAAKNKVRQAPVSVQKLEPTVFQHYVQVQGKIESNKNISVSSQMGGRITHIYVKQGDRVSKGKVIAQLDDAVMRSTIEEVQTSLDLANIMYEKQKRLWEQEIGTEVQYLTAKNQKEALEKRLSTTKEQIALSKIKAPISGIVDEIMPKVGEMLTPGFPAFRIVNASDLSLKANLSESYIPYIKRGDKVKLRFPTIDFETEARVSLVGQSIDPNNRTFKVEVKLPSNPMFKANMFGEISINDRTRKSAIVVPASIVQQSDVGPYIFIAEKSDDKWLARRKNIETDLSYDGQVEVTGGLNAGQMIVIAGYKDLSDGQEVIFDQSIANN